MKKKSTKQKFQKNSVQVRHPRFNSIRPTKSGDWIVFSLNETCRILVSTVYLERILETAKARQNGEAA